MTGYRTQDLLTRFPELTYRQLDNWTTSCYLGDDPKNTGLGGKREYTEDEIRVLRYMVGFVRAGVRPEIASKIARGNLTARIELEVALENYKHGR